MVAVLAVVVTGCDTDAGTVGESPPDDVAAEAAELRLRADRMLPMAAAASDVKAVALAADKAEEAIARGEPDLGVALLHLLAEQTLVQSGVALESAVDHMAKAETEPAEAFMKSAKDLQAAAEAILERRNAAFMQLKARYGGASPVERKAVVMTAWRVALACNLEQASARFILGLPASGDDESVMRLRLDAVGDLTRRAEAERAAAATATAETATPTTAAPTSAAPGSPAPATTADPPVPATGTAMGEGSSRTAAP